MSKLEAKIILSGVDKASRPLNQTTKSTKLLSEQLVKAKSELKSLNQTQKSLSGFTQLKNNTQKIGTELELTRNRVKSLAQALAQSSSPTKKMADDFEKAKQKAAQLKDKFNELLTATQKQRDELAKSGIKTKNLAQHQTTLRSQISNTTKSIEQQKAQLARLNEQMKKSHQIRANYDKGMQRIAVMGGVGYGALSTGRTISRGMKNLLGVGYEFDASMSSTQAVTRIADKDDPRMLALRHQARTLPLTSKFTDSEVAAGQYFLGRTGYNADQILKAMPGMLDLASAGDIDLGTTADIASNIQMAMGIPAEKMDHVADVLTAMFTRNNVDIPMLGESLKYSAGIGAAFGQSLETISATTAMMGNAGIQGSQAGTTLRQILTRIGTSEAVAKLGVKTKDKSGNMRDLVDILAEIANATKHMGNVDRAAINKKIAGQIGLTGFEILLSQSSTGELRKMRGEKGEYDGEAHRVAQLKLDNLKGDMTMLHAAYENISVELFEKNNVWLRKAIQGFTGFLHQFGEFLKRHPAVSKGIVMLGAGLVTLTTIFGALSLALMSIFGPMLMTKFILSRLGLSVGSLAIKNSLLGKTFGSLGSLIIKFATSPLSILSTAIKTLGSVFTFVGRLFLTSPIGLIVTAIAVAALLIYKYWEPIKAFFIGVWEGFTRAMAPVKTAFEPIIQLFEPLAPIFNAIGDAIGSVINWFSNLFEPVKLTSEEFESAKSAGVQFGEALAMAIKLPFDLITWLIDKVKELIEFFSSIPEKLANLPTAIGNLFTGDGGITGIFTNLGGNLVDGLMGGIQNKWNDLKSTISDLTDSVTGWFKNALGIHSPSRVFAEYGGFTVEGYRLGIDKNRNKALKSIDSLSGQIADKQFANLKVDDRSPITSGQFSVAPVSDAPQIYITINAAPNMNETDLAAKVSQEVSRHLRNQHNNFRNSYRDID
ncbi:phage tail tape measure protein [Utexia brackfieldae]|uniref:phage tail tape measure protein n=1 Tax=Utexia brackfieldae TaxID=3074108 RepID=UPI00370D9FA2